MKTLFVITILFLSKALFADWDNEQKLTASDGATNDHFGISASIDGDYAIIGAYYDDENGAESGSVYVYNNDGVFVEEEQMNTPVKTILFGNYPNPFNSSTTISFDLSLTSSFVTLDIYNVNGQKVKTLTSERLTNGRYSVLWDGNDKNNKPVSSGVYFYKLVAGDYLKVKNMILLK